MVFVGADMPHWCRIERLEHLPFERQKYIGIPYEDGSLGQGDDQGHLTYSSCQMFAFNYSALSNDELNDWNRTLLLNESTPIVDCTHWIYDQTTFVSTIVSRVSHHDLLGLKLKTDTVHVCSPLVYTVKIKLNNFRKCLSYIMKQFCVDVYIVCTFKLLSV